MNILVVVARQPFAATPTARLADMLAARLGDLDGVKAETMTIPVSAAGGESLLDAAAACGMLRTVHADRVVALNFPAYLFPYLPKVVWIADPADLPAPARGTPAEGGRPGEIARILAQSDMHALRRSDRVFFGSDEVRDLAMRWCGVAGEILPVPDEDDSGGWAAAAARIAGQ